MSVIKFRQSVVIGTFKDTDLRQVLVHYDIQMVSLERTHLQYKVIELCLDKNIKLFKDQFGDIQIIEDIK